MKCHKWRIFLWRKSVSMSGKPLAHTIAIDSWHLILKWELYAKNYEIRQNKYFVRNRYEKAMFMSEWKKTTVVMRNHELLSFSNLQTKYVEEKIHLNFRGRNNFCIVFVIIPLNFYGASITWNYATNSNYPKHIPTIHKWKKFKYRIILTHTNFSYHLYKMDSNFSFMLKCMHCMIDWNNKEKST